MAFVDVDMKTFIEQYGGEKSVKKTLTVPKWLDNMAKANHINFSATLQKALREELGIRN